MSQPENIRKIIIYGNHFWDFYNKQPEKVKEKINWTMKLLKVLHQIPKQYFKHIIGTNLYEIRIKTGTNIYRIFCFFDSGKLVVVLNGFQKKTQKTPKTEIKLAQRLQQKYYDEQN